MNQFYILCTPIVATDTANREHIVTNSKCDLLKCRDEQVENVVCAELESGSVATFRSECGVNLINCYQKIHNAPQYRIISRKACANKDMLFVQKRCDKLFCGNDQPEIEVCATNGSGTGIFRSICNIEILNCYQKIYSRPRK